MKKLSEYNCIDLIELLEDWDKFNNDSYEYHQPEFTRAAVIKEIEDRLYRLESLMD